MTKQAASVPVLPVPESRSINEYVRESQLLLWIWKSIRHISVFMDYESYLRDGVILCQLIRSLAPQLGSSNETELVPGEDKQVKKENIESFLAACRSLGLASEELFEVDDLLSLQNIPKVTQTVYALGKRLATNQNTPLLGTPYDLWLEQQLASTQDTNQRFKTLPQGEDLYISHVDTNWLKEKLEKRRAKDETNVVRPAREPLVQRIPSKPLEQLRTFFLEGPPPVSSDTQTEPKKMKKLW